MKILFVCSGNHSKGMHPATINQGKSLKRRYIDIDYFAIHGKGVIRYLRNIFILRRYLKNKKYDIIHAHYVLCILISIIASKNIPVVGSFTGSDVFGIVNKNGRRTIKGYFLILMSFLVQPFLKKIIVKSKRFEPYIYFKKKIKIIPNGINFKQFKPLDKTHCKKILNIPMKKKIILFLGNPSLFVKNYDLLKKSIKEINDSQIHLISPYPLPHEKVVYYLNATDVLVLPSFHEGSPNVIKEAMACNCPIVSTDVGDVSEVIKNTKGCYIISYDSKDLSNKIKLALQFKNRTNGRQNIKHLDIDIIANKIIQVYKDILQKKTN